MSPSVLPSGVVDRLDEDEETLLPNVSSVCTESALYGKFCDWVLEPKVDLMEVLCHPSDRCPKQIDLLFFLWSGVPSKEEGGQSAQNWVELRCYGAPSKTSTWWVRYRIQSPISRTLFLNLNLSKLVARFLHIARHQVFQTAHL